MLHLCGCFNEHSVSDVCFPSLFSPSLFFSNRRLHPWCQTKRDLWGSAFELRAGKELYSGAVFQTSGLTVEVFASCSETWAVCKFVTQERMVWRIPRAVWEGLEKVLAVTCVHAAILLTHWLHLHLLNPVLIITLSSGWGDREGLWLLVVVFFF